jgi:MoxR-like ATPase
VNRELRALWNAAIVGATKRPAGNFLFVGPSGSGKTDGAESLALESGLEFTKCDAASMTDPEAWFGTREIVVQDGVAVTDYRPSAFIESIQKPGVTFIDEINRCRDEGRQILLPVLDYTRAVMNPLTGEIVHRHPQNYIVMAGNVGLAFTGTSAIDPAFWTRATTVEFEYIDEASERHIVESAAGCDAETAYVLVRFAVDSRQRAAADDEFPAISTREIISAGQRVADGLSRDLAVKFDILNHVSSEGGTASIRNELESIWTGVRAAKIPGAPAAPATAAGDPPAAAASTWVCPAHKSVKVIPAGVSQRTGKPYSSFKACGVFGCPNTESNSQAPAAAQKAAGNTVVLCASCNIPQPAGRTTICVSCGAAL